MQKPLSKILFCKENEGLITKLIKKRGYQNERISLQFSNYALSGRVDLVKINGEEYYFMEETGFYGEKHYQLYNKKFSVRLKHEDIIELIKSDRF